MTTLTAKLSQLPTSPGVYQFKNSRQQILYIGKAKNLRARVRSYFQPGATLEPHKQELIKKISDLETIIVDTENEALILEANLIRQHKPPYNVVLTDDKYYLFIKITTDTPPRIYPVRRLKNDGARYFGPYSSARAVRHTLKLLRRIFPFKDEKDSDREIIFPHPLFSEATDDISNSAKEVIKFLKGNRNQIIKKLKHGMRQAAKTKQFEQAALWRDQLQAIERLEGYQKVHLPKHQSFDVVSLARKNNSSAINIFLIRQGRLLNKNTFLLKSRSTATDQDVVRQFILQYYREAQDIPQLIFIPEKLPDAPTLAAYINQDHPPTFSVPSRGIKKQLLLMGRQNAQQLLDEEISALEDQARLLSATKQLLTLVGSSAEAASSRIETYDISNTQGKLATGSMIVFTGGSPDKSQYRKFRIKTKNTPDDYAMLEEVLTRRFDPSNDWPRPDLVLIDGGKGQLNRSLKVISKLAPDLKIASIAKREEELFVPGQSQSIRLPHDSDTLQLIQRLRDEAHRFTLSYHRLLRAKQYKKSLLDEIPGLGPKTKKKLINHFGSLKKLKQADLEQITRVTGKKLAETIKDYL